MEIVKTQRVRVFGVKEHEKRKHTMTANVSSYEGKDQEGNATYSSWYAYFVGSAYEKAKILNDKDSIVLSKAKIASNYDKENKKQFVYLTIFDFEMYEADGQE